MPSPFLTPLLAGWNLSNAILDHVEEGNILRIKRNVREGAWAPKAGLLCHFSQICFNTVRCLETTEPNILF